MTNAKKTALLHPKTLFQGEVFHNLFIFLMNITHFYSFNNSFNYVVKNIHSKNLFIQQKKQIIHSKNLFIQNNPKLFIQRKYSFKLKMDYRPGLLIKHHLCGAHALWMEQVGYEEDRLSPENCKRKFSCAVEGLCDPKLQIERAVLKDDVFCPTDGDAFKVRINTSKSEKVATPMKRKKPQREGQKSTPFKKKCQQVEESPFYSDSVPKSPG